MQSIKSINNSKSIAPPELPCPPSVEEAMRKVKELKKKYKKVSKSSLVVDGQWIADQGEVMVEQETLVNTEVKGQGDWEGISNIHVSLYVVDTITKFKSFYYRQGQQSNH